MNRKRLFAACLVLALGILCCHWVAASAAEPEPPAAETGWGAPVDGLACRLVVQPRYFVGQAITAAVELKNTSDKKRYIYPQLDPMAIEHLTIEIVGPGGKKVAQHGYGKGYGLGENSFQPINPGEIKRFDVIDLRRHFSDLEPWQCYPKPHGVAVPPGKYTLTCRFRSPKVPPRFAVSQTVIQGKPVTQYKDASPELLAAQWANETRSAPVSFELLALGKDDLVVHEWGVFTVFNDVQYANVNRKEEWGSLPSFFYRQFPRERLRWVPSAWDAPIIYFYAKPETLHMNVNVTFPTGAPVVWWPAVARPTDDGGFRTARDPKTPRPFRSLSWEAWLGARVPNEAANSWLKVDDFPLPEDCWLRKVRLPAASQLTVVGNIEGPPRGKRFPGALDRFETERFLYYDGLVPAPDYVRCQQLDATSLTLRSRASFDLTHLFVVDRRVQGNVRFAYLNGKDQPFKAGSTRKIEPQPVAAADWPARGIQQVRRALLDAGLFEAEADALLGTHWQKRLLEADGVTVFHILPVSEYDRMLKLEVLPAPAVKPVRVGIALHPHVEIEPKLAERVTTLIRQLDDNNFEKRTAANRELLEIGPMAIGMLRAELQNRPALEVRRRIEAVLDRVDAAEWLKPAVKGK